MPRIVVVGDALIDEIRDDRGTREFVGGAALNVAVGLSRLGCDTSLVAMVGDDEAGERIRAHLSEHGVALFASPAPHGSARAVSTRIDGEPQYAFNRAAEERLVTFDDAARAAVAEADLVAISCAALDSPAQIAAFDGALRDARLALDPNPRAGMMHDRTAFRGELARVARRAELIKVGGDDAELLGVATVDDLAARLRAEGAPVVVATRGAAGATVIAEGASITRPIVDLPGPIVDTMGAGDAVFAALIVALVGGEQPDWAAALDRALAIAAATCREEGALLRLPDAG